MSAFGPVSRSISSWHPRKSGCSLHLGLFVIFLKEWKTPLARTKQEDVEGRDSSGVVFAGQREVKARTHFALVIFLKVVKRSVEK